MGIYAVKTVSGKEAIVAERIESLARRKNAKIYAIVKPGNIKGYIFVEADNPGEIIKIIYRMKDVKGLVKSEVNINELKELLKPKEKEIKVEVGQLVVIVAGPFKGEKAKVTSVNYEKGKITIELINFPVSTPVTTKLEYVRPLEEGE